MNSRSVSLSIVAIFFSLFLVSSCAEKKSEEKQEVKEVKETKKEVSSSEVAYQCPMDCEDGKTYHEAGSCPTCKMDLKETSKQHSKACKMHEGGDCSCKADKCQCKDCKQHAQANTCKEHKDGKCTCEGEKCKCENCTEHA